MTAKRIIEEAPGGKRTPLAEVLPLATPFVVQIFPIYACNFSCKYCHCSIKKEDRCFVTEKTSMKYELFERICDEMKSFSNKIKTLRFVGMGEPLLHKEIAKMVSYAKKKDIANTVELLTNGSLLTAQMSEELIAAGLDRMVISIQGTGGDKYKEVSQINLDFQDFIKKIEYFYSIKKNTHVYIKITDCALEDKRDEALFYRIFENICDSIGVEHTVPIFPGVEFNLELSDEHKEKVTQFGKHVDYVPVCPQPFYTMQINPDGKVVGCHSIPYPEILGDCNKDRIDKIWNGDKFNQFRLKMLEGRDTVCDLCRECNIMNYRAFEEDNISSVAEKLRYMYK